MFERIVLWLKRNVRIAVQHQNGVTSQSRDISLDPRLCTEHADRGENTKLRTAGLLPSSSSLRFKIYLIIQLFERLSVCVMTQPVLPQDTPRREPPLRGDWGHCFLVSRKRSKAV